MKKIIFIFIVLLGFTVSLSLEAAIAFAPHNDEDLIAYGASDPQFKASVWLDPACSASRIKLSEDDMYDFYITAGHCAFNIVNEFEETEKIYSEMLEKGMFNLETIECEESCEQKSFIHKMFRSAVDLGLIEKPFPTFKDFYDFMQFYINNKHLLDASDKIHFSELKCIVHPSYHNDEYINNEDENDEDKDEEEDNEIDMALCTSYKKNTNIPQYKLKFIENYQDVEETQLVSVSFGIRNTSNALTNMIPARQAFNTLVGQAWKGMEQNNLENIVGPQLSISEKPAGFCESGDSGGTLLFKNDDGTYSLIAVTEGGGGSTHWAILDKKFIQDAYKQLVQETEIQKAEL